VGATKVAGPSRDGSSGQPGLLGQALQGHLASALTRDDILDNITLYWLTNTGISSARLYWENKADFFDAKDISIPFAISVFPDELYQAPRSWAQRAISATTASVTPPVRSPPRSTAWRRINSTARTNGSPAGRDAP
jgi:hypothetical protein